MILYSIIDEERWDEKSKKLLLNPMDRVLFIENYNLLVKSMGLELSNPNNETSVLRRFANKYVIIKFCDIDENGNIENTKLESMGTVENLLLEYKEKYQEKDILVEKAKKGNVKSLNEK